MKLIKKHILSFVALVLLSIPSIMPLLRPGFFLTDDGEWMIIRFSAFYQALSGGQFPVRFLGRLNQEYGYPVANFLYPGFMYLASPIHLLGFGFVDSIKIIMTLSLLCSALFVYVWLSKLFGKIPSVIGALVYLYSPYHLFDTYKRGSVGEILALAVVPFILWQIERKSVLWVAIGIASLIVSHNTLAILFVPVIIGYMVFRNILSIKEQVVSILLGLVLSSFFWLPAIFDLQYTVFFQTKVADWENYFSTLNLVGYSLFTVFIVTLLFLLDPHSRKFILLAKNINNQTVYLLFGVGIMSLFFSLPISFSVWNLLPVSFIQFPFRFLSLALISAAFLSAFLIAMAKGKNQKTLSIIMLLIIGFSAMPYLKPQAYFDKGEGFYATNMDTTTVKNEYMPKWVKKIPSSRAENKVEIKDGNISDLRLGKNLIAFNANSNKGSKAIINMVYFPGWTASIDGKTVQTLYPNEDGNISIYLPSGIHAVSVYFSETSVRLLSDILSLGGIFVILFYAFKCRVNKGVKNVKS